ncbi:MAG: protein-disulfide reductase DsbD family protein [Ignavibacteria bacterium]|nr:protein-disulfide reductase DsbD family protein [Ignavibacteria bacterium]
MKGKLMKFLNLLLSGMVLLFLFLHAESDAQPVEKQHTRIELLANASSVAPGSTFLIGLRMTMDPGWHTYWKNAGEAGLPPTIQWTLPEGVTPGEILWPAPHKYTEGGEVITYGYEKENMLLIPMEVASTLPSAQVVIRADVDWLECELVCIPGSATAELVLPVSREAGVPANVTLFQQYQAAIPPGYEPGGELRISSGFDRDGLVLTVRPGRLASLTDVDFFPEAFDELLVGRTAVSNTDEGVVVRVPISLHEKGKVPPSFKGLVVYGTSGGKHNAVSIDIPIPPEAASGLKAPGDKDDSGVGLLDREFIIGDPGATDQPLLLYLFFALVGGMLLNIMPCVLPVIGLKVFGLVRMGGEDPRQVRKLGWFFSAGIVASFLVLAILVIGLKTAGEQIGWGFQFQEPAFVVVMSAVVMAFGLSLFGVFEIQLPSAATVGVSDLVNKAGGRGGGALGSFSEGVFATILATPCTAPILGTALGFAFSQPPLIILLMFVTVAAGMALPYLVLTLRPSWMKILPKPGEWMVTAKQFMGFLMMATLIWLLYILGKQLGMEAVIWTVAFLLTVSLACWIIGRFATLTASRSGYALAWTAAILVTIGGWFWFQQPVLEARDLLSKNVAAEGIPWEPFSLVVLDDHLAAGRPVFIDFTAEWCLTCKVNEKTVLAQDDVVEKFRSSGIVSIKADWTNRNADITQLLAKFGRSGVPLYVLFPAGKPNEPIILPEVITGGIVLDALEQATGKQ